MHTTHGIKFPTFIVLGALLCATLLVGCGNVSDPPPVTPTVTGVDPASGLVAGGELLQVTGTGFIPGATVLIGGNPATNVMIVDSNTLTCNAPAGLPGAQCAVQVNTAGGLGVMLGAYLYIPPPSIAQVVPNESSTFGGMQHTLLGSGFMDNGAGPNAVLVDGNPATSVVTINDSTLLFTAPAGTAGLTNVEVTNANGTDDDPLNYFIPIMAAQGGGNYGTWSLYAIQASTGIAYTIGALTVGITGLDFHPTTGTLYGVTARGTFGGGPPVDLVTIDPATAQVTLVGTLSHGSGFDYIPQDICFVGSTLYGTCEWDRNLNETGILIEIDPATGVIPNAFPGLLPFDPGHGFAADATSTNVYWMSWTFSLVSVLDVTTPILGPGVPLGGPFSASLITAAGYHLGTLYGVEGAGPNPTQLHAIDPLTGVTTPIGPPLPERISAVASPVR